MPFVTCPGCGHESIAPRELIGLEWNCPKCRAEIPVEDESTLIVPRRRKAKKGMPPVIIVLGILALGAVTVVTVIAAVAKTSDDGKKSVAIKEKAREKSAVEVSRPESEPEFERTSPAVEGRPMLGGIRASNAFAALISLAIGGAALVAPVLIGLKAKNLKATPFNTAIVWGCAGFWGMAAIGIALSQFSPVFGGFIEQYLCEPFSVGRVRLIPAHVFAFGSFGLLMGAGAVAFKTHTVR